MLATTRIDGMSAVFCMQLQSRVVQFPWSSIVGSLFVQNGKDSDVPDVHHVPEYCSTYMYIHVYRSRCPRVHAASRKWASWYIMTTKRYLTCMLYVCMSGTCTQREQPNSYLYVPPSRSIIHGGSTSGQLCQNALPSVDQRPQACSTSSTTARTS